MRPRLVLLAALATVLLISQPVWALCLVEPFDQVVKRSDAVLVGTVVEAEARSHRVAPHSWVRSGILVRLDVDEVLSGSARDGDRVVVTSCGPVMFGKSARQQARQMVGTRGLFLLTVHRDGVSYNFGQVTTPQRMTLDEEIVRARDVLGLPSTQPPGPLLDGVDQPWWWWWLWASIATLIVLLVGAGVAVLRRRST